MDKAQAIHDFWSRFSLPVYDENTVDDDAVMPYITYSVATGSLEDIVLLNASLWYRSTSWADITHKADEIAQYLTHMSPPAIKIDGGRAYFTKGSPFAQRLSDDGDELVRRILLQVEVEFLTSS